MNTNIKNFHILKITYVDETSLKPSRVKIASERFRQSVLIPFDTDHGIDSCEIAEHWLLSNGFTVAGHSEGKECYFIITDTFEPLKKKK